MEQNINIELENILTWLKVNKLSLNIGKTHYMIFDKQKRRSIQLKIKIENQEIEHTCKTKFLGVITRAVMHAGITNPRWRGKRSRHSRRMRNPQFYISGKRAIGFVADHLSTKTTGVCHLVYVCYQHPHKWYN